MAAHRDEVVRLIVERRLAQAMPPSEEARFCMSVLVERGFSAQYIAERCGMDRNAVYHWKYGLSAPKTITAWARLATLTRRALALQPREVTYSGMGRVIAAIMAAHGIPASEVARRAGIKWPQQYGGRWLRGVEKPNRRNTVRLRTLAREARLGPEILALCDARLRELTARRGRLDAECAARIQSKALRLQRQQPPESAPMIEIPTLARAAR